MCHRSASLPIILLALLLLAGCHPSMESLRSTVPSPRHRALLFVPGYKGTALKDATTDERIWITAREALFGSHEIALPLTALGLGWAPRLEPDGLLDKVSIVPGLFSVDAYGGTLKALRNELGSEIDIFPFPYDWREDLVRSAALLDEAIKGLHQRGYSSVSLVTHSMGGLLAAYYLRFGVQDDPHPVETWEGAHHVERVVFAAVPFRGALTIFRDMHVGIANGPNRSLLSARAVSSFPSSYQLLPNPDDHLILDEQLAPLARQPIYDINFYREQHWGLLQETGTVDSVVATARTEYLETQLTRAACLSRLLSASTTTPLPIPALELRGSGAATLHYGVWLPSHHTMVFTPEDARRYLSPGSESHLFVDGDGTVATTSSLLPHAYRPVGHYAAQKVVARHGSVFLAPESRTALRMFFGEGQISSGESSADHERSRLANQINP